MKFQPNDVLLWDGDDGILKHGQEYLVWQIRDGRRGQEFPLKDKGWWMVEPIFWYEADEPFIPIHQAVPQKEFA
jgi:hypothetical protein